MRAAARVVITHWAATRIAVTQGALAGQYLAPPAVAGAATGPASVAGLRHAHAWHRGRELEREPGWDRAWDWAGLSRQASSG